MWKNKDPAVGACFKANIGGKCAVLSLMEDAHNGNIKQVLIESAIDMLDKKEKHNVDR